MSLNWFPVFKHSVEKPVKICSTKSKFGQVRSIHSFPMGSSLGFTGIVCIGFFVHCKLCLDFCYIYVQFLNFPLKKFGF